MAEFREYIAVDLGAESGRVILGTISADTIKLTEIYRFSSSKIEQKGPLCWDFERIFAEVKTGIAKAAKQCKGLIAGIGVNSWGVDYGLIGKDGVLLENPYHYRDSRTDGIIEKTSELMPKRDIYENTGIPSMQFNTIYQLFAARLDGYEALKKAEKLIFMADLVSYYLSGQVFTEYTLGSTSQLMDMRTGKWSQEVFEKLDLPIGIMPEIVQPGTIVGELKKELADELGCGAIPVIAVASHDTNSAVAAVPADVKNWAYISSGTWSLMGIATSRAIITDKSFEYGFANEGGVANTICFLKNIMGLWLVQECRRHWQQAGVELSYSELTEMAEKAKPFAAHIDPDYGEFFSPGDMPIKINKYLKQTGQSEIEDKGQMVRVILEALAFTYRRTIDQLEDVSGDSIKVLHIVGGGIQNELLCQFAADATGKKVVAGPIEATGAGNIIMQAIAAGQIKSIEQGKSLVRNSFEVKEYLPQDSQSWQRQYEKLKA